jgi:hypothetical protein
VRALARAAASGDLCICARVPRRHPCERVRVPRQKPCKRSLRRQVTWAHALGEANALSLFPAGLRVHVSCHHVITITVSFAYPLFPSDLSSLTILWVLI